VCVQDTGQLGVKPFTALSPEGRGKPAQNACYEYSYGFSSHN
jgi:hypothetical protein